LTGVSAPCANGPYTDAIKKLNPSPVPGECYAFSSPGGLTDVAGNALAPSPLTCAPTTVDDSDLPVAYQWGTVPSNLALGGSFTQEKFGAATARFTFTGTTLTWYTVKGPDQGLAGISISNHGAAVVPSTINNYAPTTQVGAPIVFSGLPAGSHTLVITVKGQLGNPAGTDTRVSIDGVSVDGGAPVVTPSMNYRWSNGPGFGYVFTSQKNASFNVRFRGTGISWNALVGPNNGKASVLIDGKSVATQDLYAPGFSSQNFAYSGLSYGLHTLKIVVLGTKQAASSDTIITLNSLAVS
jgi:hypothetical protein